MAHCLETLGLGLGSCKLPIIDYLVENYLIYLFLLIRVPYAESWRVERLEIEDW